MALIPFFANAKTTASKATNSTAVYGGYLASDDNSYAYLGGIKAINNDLRKDGFLLKAATGYGTYDYQSADNHFSGRIAAGEFAVGYQKYFNLGRVSFYFGGDYQDSKISPEDINNNNSGGDFGAKGQFELSLNIDKVRVNHLSSYSGAYNSYWTYNMIGWDFGHFIFGPEATFLGNKAFDQQRYGASVSNINLANFAKLQLSAGKMFVSRRGDDSFYASVALAKEF